MQSTETREATKAIARWRDVVIDRALWLTLGALALAAATIVVHMHSVPPVVAYVSAACLVMLVGALMRGATRRFRQWALVLSMGAACSQSLLRNGYVGANGLTVLLMLSVLVTMAMGRRAAWLVWGASAVGLTVAAAHFAGGGQIDRAELLELGSVNNWIRIGAIYLGVAAATITAVGYMTERLESGLRRAEALRLAVAQESAERIAASEAAQALEARLRQGRQLEALGTLAGGVAHEFNNQLLVILSNADLAAEEAQSDTQRKALGDIRSAGERVAALTRQLLVFAQQPEPESRTVVRVDDRIAASLELLRRLIPSSVEVEHVAEGRGGHVWAHQADIDQVIMNLCINAGDAMPDGGRLTVATRERTCTPPEGGAAGDYVCIDVSDTGVGMDAATAGRVAEPFFTTKAGGDSVGLGVSTVHGIVKRAGGWLEVDSTPSRGATIRVFWPAHSGPQPSDVRDAIGAVERGTETILVAEDDGLVRMLLAHQLELRGYRVLTCEDGEDALDVFRRQSEEIGLVITDAVMPNMGGRELHEAITSEFRQVPFIFCSGYTAHMFETDFFDGELRCFMPKPFEIHQLCSKMRALLDEAKRVGPARAPSSTPLPEPSGRS